MPSADHRPVRHERDGRQEAARHGRRMPMHVEGFTREVPYFMGLADFFIGKPGPGSISEALAMRLPVIVERNAWTLAHERYNADWSWRNRASGWWCAASRTKSFGARRNSARARQFQPLPRTPPEWQLRRLRNPRVVRGNCGAGSYPAAASQAASSALRRRCFWEKPSDLMRLVDFQKLIRRHILQHL